MLEQPLSEIANIFGGYAFKSKDLGDEGVPVVKIAEINPPNVDLEDCERIPESKIEGLERFLLSNGSIVMAMTGATTGKAGRIRGGQRAYLNQRVARLSAKGGIELDDFIWAVVSQPGFDKVVIAHAHGSAQPNISSDAIGQISIQKHTVEEQLAIGRFCRALDEKIEQNRKTAAALERLARAIFRAWFVDFEPVKAKATGATSFPSMPQDLFDTLPTTFQDSELGPIPEGWGTATIDELTVKVSMGPFGSSIKRDNFVEKGVPVVRGGNLTNGFVDRDFVYLTEEKADELRNANAYSGDIVITHRGTLGQVGLIPRLAKHRRYVVSQSQMLVRALAEVSPSFLYHYFISPIGQHTLLANRNQTGVPAIATPTTSVKGIRLIAPPVVLMNGFSKLSNSLLDYISATELESQKLGSIRDYLLPKLLSGAVRVAHIEAMQDHFDEAAK